MTGPVRDERGRILDGVTRESTETEIAEAVARRDAEDARNRADLARLGIRNGIGPGWSEV